MLGHDGKRHFGGVEPDLWDPVGCDFNGSLLPTARLGGGLRELVERSREVVAVAMFAATVAGLVGLGFFFWGSR